jgi:hypothetical protein
MDFFTAMEKLKAGKKVRVSGWDEGKFIGLQEEKIKVFGKKKSRYTIINDKGQCLDPLVSLSLSLRADWALYQDDQEQDDEDDEDDE